LGLRAHLGRIQSGDQITTMMATRMNYSVKNAQKLEELLAAWQK
jgi:hypothetical protein